MSSRHEMFEVNLNALLAVEMPFDAIEKDENYCGNLYINIVKYLLSILPCSRFPYDTAHPAQMSYSASPDL